MAPESVDPLSVLLIEDTMDDELLAIRAIRRCGTALIIDVARDGREALDFLGVEVTKERARVPDLIISDLKMPKLSGAEVLEKARKDARLREVPFIIFSSSDDPADIQNCMGLGANAYCVKPVNFSAYTECVTEMVQKWLVDLSLERPECALAINDGT